MNQPTMKKQQYIQPDQDCTTFKRSLALTIVAVVVCLSHSVQASISVGTEGSGTLTFATAPAVTEFTTGVLVGGGASYEDVTALNAGVAGVNAANIVRQLPTNFYSPPGTFSGGMRWNNVLFALTSRPTTDGTNAAGMLLAKIQNDTGADASKLNIAYDFDVQSLSGGALPGFYVYYSLSGEPDTWVAIPTLSGSEVPQRVFASVDLTGSPWLMGTTLYVLWVDDNANGITDPSYTIDNLVFDVPVERPVAITQQPQSQTVIELESVTFTVGWRGSPMPTFQWYANDAVIPNATDASYFIPAVSRSLNGLGFWVVAENLVSNVTYSATSAVAVLTVVSPPFITVPPASQTLVSGSVLSLAVEAGGTEPLSYQWRNEVGNIPGATNAAFVVNPGSTNDAGNYVVVVTNPYGAVTSSVATVTVFVPVAIFTPPVTQVVAAGGTATFYAVATGYPAPSYRWWFEDAALPGANGSSLVITNVGTNVLGTYRIEVWNEYSTTTSAPAQLVMSPSLRSPFLGLTATWGKPATLRVSAIGSGLLGYQWFKDGALLPEATNATLEFPVIQISDGGLYSVVVSSPWGSVTNTPAQLVVNPANIALGLYAGVIIDGVAGYTYGIQYSTDLRDTNSWVTATNLTLTEPVQLWVDTSVNIHGTNSAKRYYRVVGE